MLIEGNTALEASSLQKHSWRPSSLILTGKVSLKAFSCSSRPAEHLSLLAEPPAPGSPSGNLFFTGATASIRGGPRSSAFAPAKNGLRAFSQSLAREYHPQNIHIAHFVIDGIIDTERISGFLGDKFEADTRMAPE